MVTIFINATLTEIVLLCNQVAAEIHQRLMEVEKENQPADPKEKSPQMGANKKVKKEPPKKKQEDKKPKGIYAFSTQNSGSLNLSLVENKHLTRHVISL